LDTPCTKNNILDIPLSHNINFRKTYYNPKTKSIVNIHFKKIEDYNGGEMNSQWSNMTTDEFQPSNFN